MNDPAVDKLIDGILEVFKEQNAISIAYDAMDKIYRPYLQWMHAAQLNKEDAGNVRQSLLNIISAMMVEASSRMSGMERDGTRVPKEVWLGEFMLDLKNELVEDLEYHGRHH